MILKKMGTIYEKIYYVMQGKTKLCCDMNLNFFDLTDKDLNFLLIYENETVRYKGKWFVVKRKKTFFNFKSIRDKFPENWIKYPYKKAIPV